PEVPGAGQQRDQQDQDKPQSKLAPALGKKPLHRSLPSPAEHWFSGGLAHGGETGSSSSYSESSAFCPIRAGTSTRSSISTRRDTFAAQVTSMAEKVGSSRPRESRSGHSCPRASPRASG